MNDSRLVMPTHDELVAAQVESMAQGKMSRDTMALCHLILKDPLLRAVAKRYENIHVPLEAAVGMLSYGMDLGMRVMAARAKKND